VASHDIGPAGLHLAEPLVVQWSWRYAFPTLPLWMLILVLFGLKANRHPQAWLILLPLGLVMLVWRMPLQLLSISDGPVQTIGFFVESGVLAWTIVWLLGRRLATRHRGLSFLLIYAVLCAVGLLSYYLQYEERDEIVPLMIGFGVCCIPLPLAMMLASRFSRGSYSKLRFNLSIVLWTGLTTAATMFVLFAVMAIINFRHLPGMLFLLFVMAIYTLSLTCILCLINLPFLILAFKSPFYRRRFERLFRIEKGHFIVDQRLARLKMEPISKEPTAKPVAAADLLGRWEFYLDQLTLTVRITFRADRTFSQTMLFNRGEVRDCPGGTWHLDGPHVHLDGYVPASHSAGEPRTWWMIDTQDGFALFGGDDADSQSFVPIRRNSTSH
jgi:hypothetical protein